MINYILVITEKPSSARIIARALDDEGKPRTCRERGVPFLISKRQHQTLVIVSALGHLYSLTQNRKKWAYPVYDMKWVPMHLIKKSKKRSSNFIDVIKKLSKGAIEYISACDLDIEGSLIAYNLMLHACGEHSLINAKRMKFSTLTRHELIKSYMNLKELDHHIIDAGKTRHEVDWLYGINFSRALTQALSNVTKKKKTLSIGRVQGPTLKFIYEREVEINKFIPTPFWKLYAETTLEGEKFSLDFKSSRLNQTQAKKLTKICRGKVGKVVKINVKLQKQHPPPSFNLGDLQKEAYSKFKITPVETLKRSEKLYLSGYISYPRTSSQKLPVSINLKNILTKLKLNLIYKEFSEEILQRASLNPKQGKQDDLAHPSIHPTGKLPKKLNKSDEKIYDLICKRFLACLGEPSIRKIVKASVEVNDHLFFLNGSEIQKKGWMKYYNPYVSLKEISLPSLTEGMLIPITKFVIRRNFTKAPKRYDHASLLKLMEEKKIGTKTTRSNIIEILYKRGYIHSTPVKITKLGKGIIETLLSHSPEILSIKLTRNLERQLELIQNGKLDGRKLVMNTVETLKPIFKRFKKNEEKIGLLLNIYLSENSRLSSNADCVICSQEKSVNQVYCSVHSEVSKNIQKQYIVWKKALDITWLEYLGQVSQLKSSGQLVKETSKDILRRT